MFICIAYDEKINLTKQKRTSLKKESVGWYQQYDMQDWIDSEPSLNNVDLRPYYFICKENIDYLSGIGNDSDILEAVNILLQKSTVIASKIEFLRSLSPKQSEQVIDHVWDNNLGMYHIQSKQKSRLFKTLICSECDTAGLYQVA